MITKKYNYLPHCASQIRIDVFMKEQGFCDEFDSIDRFSIHLVLFDASIPIATCRYYWNKDKNSYVIGRIAVSKSYRGQSMGSYILQKAQQHIEKAGGNNIYLAAQVNAKEFYEKQGYTVVGKPFFEEHCQHIWMFKSLEIF